MATITERVKKNGRVSYTAQIRLRINNKHFTQSKTFKDKRVAELWAAKREDEIHRVGLPVHTENISIKEVIEAYEEDFGYKEQFGRTKSDHLKFLKKCIGFHELNAVSLSPQDLIRHAKDRAKGGTGPATINNDFIWLRNAMRGVKLSRSWNLNLQVVDDAAALLRKERIIGKAKERNRRPTVDEMTRIMEYFSSRDPRSKVKMVPVVLFAMFSARRQDEIIRLDSYDYEQEKKGVTVRLMKHPREKKDTFVFLTGPAVAILSQEIENNGRLPFPYNGKTVSNYFTDACHFLSIKDLVFHDLRHEAVSWMFELGWDIPRVSSVSGHKSWGTLKRYAHLHQFGIKNKWEDWDWYPKDLIPKDNAA